MLRLTVLLIFWNGDKDTVLSALFTTFVSCLFSAVVKRIWD